VENVKEGKLQLRNQINQQPDHHPDRQLNHQPDHQQHQHVLITPNSSEVVKYGNQEDTVQTVKTRVSWRNIVDDLVDYVEEEKLQLRHQPHNQSRNQQHQMENQLIHRNSNSSRGTS